MARVQTLVQLSDALLAALDQRAAKQDVSRSEIIRTAVEAYLEEDVEALIDATVLAGYDAIPADAPAPWVSEFADAVIDAEPW